MDRNENGYPRGRAVGSTLGGRDCTGNMVDSQKNGNCGPMTSSGCADCLDTKPLAYSYNPIQRWQMLYTTDKALGRGTLFEELDKPLGVYGNE